MPPVFSSPGAYIDEVPAGVRTIAGVATSITAFIGRARRGPTDRPGHVRSFAEFERLYGSLWEPAPLGYAVKHFFANGGSEAVIARVHNRATCATLSLPAFKLVAASEGKWGNQLRVRVDHASEDRGDDALFNLSVRDMASLDTEQHANVSITPDHPRFIGRVLAEQSQLIRIADPVGDMRPEANAPLPEADADPFGDATSTPFSGDGDDGQGVTQEDIIDPAHEAGQRGLWLFDQVDLFNLMVVPPLDRATDVPAAVWNRAAEYCADRRAVLIVDAPAAWHTTAEVIGRLSEAVDATDSAAIYFPRILAPDPLDESRMQTFAPSGAIAGVIARTDAARGVWKSPAGVEATINGASGISLGGEAGQLGEQEISFLNTLGVNCLRRLPQVGHVVWGARTLRGADRFGSQWKYLPVRRLGYYIEESLFRGTPWAAFERNDETLWARLRLSCDAFMQELFRQGAFQGAVARDAYFVNCSRETTTAADVAGGVVNLLIGFAPLRRGEFILVRIQQPTRQQ
jgi:phage tail sheath protein FI